VYLRYAAMTGDTRNADIYPFSGTLSASGGSDFYETVDIDRSRIRGLVDVDNLGVPVIIEGFVAGDFL